MKSLGTPPALPDLYKNTITIDHRTLQWVQATRRKLADHFPIRTAPVQQDSPQNTPEKKPIKRRGHRLLYLPLVLLAAYFVAAVGCQRSIIYPTHVLPDVSANLPPEGAIKLTRKVDEIEVEAWLLPGEPTSPDDKSPQPLVVMAHGNGELIDYMPTKAEPYRERGLSVLLVEYRGYGRSGGKPSQSAIVSDFSHFLEEVSKRPEIDGKNVILHGRSLGGGMVAQLAKEQIDKGNPPAGMILESTFTSIAAIASSYYIPRLIVLDPLDVKAVIQKSDYPILIMHGRDDRVIPVAHATANHAAAPDSELVIFNDRGHNDFFPTTEYWRAIDKLLADAIEVKN
jgi:pimeloyl-ACP methyl ester carboxylesterase